MNDDAVMDNPVDEPTHQVVHDPVCHMDLSAADAVGTAKFQGLTFYFCSVTCHQAFDADPAGIVEQEHSYHQKDVQRESK